MLEKNKIGAIILSGGKSTRMGTDKGWLNFKGQAMINHVIKQVNQVTDHLIIIANHEKYHELPYPVHEDLIQNKGPLSGVITGLHHTKFELNLVLSCDIPFIDKEILCYIIENSTQHAITIAKWGDKIHPLIGCYQKKTLPFLSKELNNDQLKIKNVLKKMNVNYLNCNHFNESKFANLNTQEDLISTI